MKRSWILFSLALTMIGGGAGAVTFFKQHQKLGHAGVLVGAAPILDSEGKTVRTNSVLLPATVSGWKSEAATIQTSELDTLPKDTTYGRRIYENATGCKALMSVILMGTDRTSIHKPEFCLPGQGWSLISQYPTSIRVEGNAPYDLPVMKWIIGRKAKDSNGQIVDIRGVYVFWFVSDTRITAQHSGRMTSIVKNLLTKGELERWAYVACFSPCAAGAEEATFVQLQQLIANSVPEFQLTRGAAGGSTGIAVQKP